MRIATKVTFGMCVYRCSDNIFRMRRQPLRYKVSFKQSIAADFTVCFILDYNLRCSGVYFNCILTWLCC